MPYPCEIQEQLSRPTLSIRFRSSVSELPQQFGRVFGAIGHYLAELGVIPAGPAFAVYHNMDMQDLDIEAGFPVPRPLPDRGEIRAREIPGGIFGICHFTGPYDASGTAYDDLADYAHDHGYQPSGVAYEWYVDGPDVSAHERRTDIAFPLWRIEDVAPV